MGALPRLNVGIYCDRGRRAVHLSQAMAKGVEINRDRCTLVNTASYIGETRYDVAVFYGLKGNLLQIHKDYVKEGRKAVLIDLGYWHRHWKGVLNGYHKIVVNSFHPSDYMQKVKHSDDRLRCLNIELKPFKKVGRHIVIAGMSEKAAWVYGLKPLEYETQVIEQLKNLTDRPLIYRPKPSWEDASPLPGIKYSPPTQPLNEVIQDAHAVVTHHSNVAIDCIINGIPAFVVDSIAKPISKTDLAELENPYYPAEEERYQWLSDAAYLQWHVEEIRNGKAWAHLKKEQLL
jgi:hypothetical protein